MIVLQFKHAPVILGSPSKMFGADKPVNIGWTRLLILAGISTTIGSSLTVGYNIGVVNSPAGLIKAFCNESFYERFGLVLGVAQLDVLWSAIVSIFLVGGAAGSLSGSWLADRVGRKGAIVTSTVLAVVSSILFVTSKSLNSVEMLILGRLLVGMSSGLATCVVPMYLMELAPLKLRGAVGVLCPLGVTFGVLVGQVMSLSQVLGKEDTWPVLLGFYLVFVGLSSVALPFLPESPKYLYIVKGETQLAIRQLEKIRGVEQQSLVADMQELQAEQSCETKVWNLKTVLGDKNLLLPILLVCSMQAGQQFVGINAVFYYSVSIFMSAGLSEQNSQYATIGAGVINLAMAVISIPVMSRVDRRLVFQISSSSAAVCLFILGIAISYIDTISWMPYLSIVGVLGFVFCYGIGLGPIPYFIGSELFEVGPRPSAMALGSMANWAGNFIIGMTFPTMQMLIGANSFFIFAIVAVLLFVFIRMYLPETRGCDPIVIAHYCRNGLSLSVQTPMSPVNTLNTDETTTAGSNEYK
ncbi:PREDICTED: solute carrier family 2, facilitated glucose transporter member 1-like isoform X2 [Nicrophorus vespilloides]|uniref:Solute carrier family 2, facilitated glucose transporter member 1-like isoform X2 n=1 Tax=Nicrophorus vespilloides TaxID=110193 RepID=A0ABM1MN07_NICVS|nr:PREDICTED: solute carrier family 2, facilitated glucose transporter member 1-like isoform X2 [Nicrophorus vespilloides]XP_017775958.1 PREDICTED: solute carrier family 2, facilitated glucose transporter member 1-like isoform X2 [Nicrophorus vespilloides]